MTTLVGSGLFSVDVNGFAEGPLAHWLDFKTARAAADIRDQTFEMLQALVILHLVAIALYTLVLKANLIGPMITGWRRSNGTTKHGTHSVTATCGRVFAGLVLSVGIVAIITSI